MKLFDKVRIVNDRKEYLAEGVSKGMIGRIWSGEIRDNSFFVIFIDERFYDKNFVWNDENIYTTKDDILTPIFIKDMEVIEEGNATDQDILDDIPLNNPKWWCKVEGGYIMNLLGEKKNKIPYDYDS